MGTIFKDGQYVDPATSTLEIVFRQVIDEEGAITSGARGFHCMPSMEVIRRRVMIILQLLV